MEEYLNGLIIYTFLKGTYKKEKYCLSGIGTVVPVDVTKACGEMEVKLH
jgi:hypothetical protein